MDRWFPSIIYRTAEDRAETYRRAFISVGRDTILTTDIWQITEGDEVDDDR
jgi:hypothetical protein